MNTPAPLQRAHLPSSSRMLDGRSAGEGSHCTTVLALSAWNGDAFRGRPQRSPWPALDTAHRAQARISRDLGEAAAIARKLRAAAEGLWCVVMQSEIRLAVDHFLLVVASGFEEDALEPAHVVRELASVVSLVDAVLGCVGILDDYEDLALTRDVAASLRRRMADIIAQKRQSQALRAWVPRDGALPRDPYSLKQ